MPPSHLDAEILKLAARAAGFTVTPLQGRSTRSVDGRCRALLHEGRLFKAKISHKKVRWFASKEQADRAINLAQPTVIVHDAKPSYRPADDPAPMVITSKTKFTRCPPYVAPYQNGLGAIEFGLQRGRVVAQKEPS